MILFLLFKDITALHGGEANVAVSRIVGGGLYFQ